MGSSAPDGPPEDHRLASVEPLRVRRSPALLPPVALAIGFLTLPLAGLLGRTPWGSLPQELSAPGVRSALYLSLICSLAAVLVGLTLGVPLAWVLAFGRFRGRSLLRALTTLPMVLPPVVGGVGLLLAFGRRGLAGRFLGQAFGISLPFTTAGAILAASFVSMPFMVITVEAGLRSIDRRLEEAAATLGASRTTIFRRVILPLIAPSLGAGAALSWTRALGEFGATITFAGNLPGRTQTVPLAVYLALQSGSLNGAIVMSLVLLLVSLGVLLLLRDRLLQV